MRIVVVGNIVADTIEHADGSITESLGGIAHTLSALSALGGGRHAIIPVCRIGGDRREQIESWAAGLDGVSLEAVLPAAGPHPAVRLSYADNNRRGERVERLCNAPAPLAAGDLTVAEDAAAIVVNCITGDDVTPAAVRYLRAAAPRVYLDVHSLALGRRPSGQRYHRRRNDWAVWLGCADVVQCNLAEAAIIASLPPQTAGRRQVGAAIERLVGGAVEAGDGSRSPCTEDRDPHSSRTEGGPRSPRTEGGSCQLCAGPHTWALTLGAEGALLLRRRKDAVETTRIAAPAVEAVDPTGAGDAFGAAYVCAWLDGCEPREAAERGVLSGTAACTRPGVPDPLHLRRTVEELRADRDSAPTGQNGSSSAICRSR